MTWLSLRAAARASGVTLTAIRQRLHRKTSPLPHDYARDPDGAPLEPRQPLIRMTDLQLEFPDRLIRAP